MHESDQPDTGVPARTPRRPLAGILAAVRSHPKTWMVAGAAVAFVLLILVLLLRPGGLLGRNTVEKV